MFSELAKESSSELSLDEIFELQTLDLTKCILELSDLSDLKLIRKWHNILCKAKTNELEERNELCAIMLDQLRREGKLCASFRDKNNEKKSLNQLLKQLKQERAADKSKIQNQIIMEDAAGEVENKADEEVEDLDLLGKTTPSRTTVCNIYYPRTTRTHLGTVYPSEMKQLEYQLQSLQTKLDAQNETLKFLGKQLETHEEETQNQKQALEVLMLNVVQHFQNYFGARTNGSKLTLRFFQTNFAYLTNDPQLHFKMKELDKSLERAFNTYARNVRNSAKQKIENRTVQNTEKFRHTMLEEFETIASTKLWVQEVRIRAMKQQFLAALRTQLSKLKCERAKVNFNIEKIMKLVDREYKKIFEDFVEGS